MSRTVTITKTGTTPTTASPKITQNVAIGRMLNNKLDIKSKREQLVNTYLTFAYEMRPGLDNRVFWKYVILLLFSIDQIAGVYH
jgi:TATA-box binding protein (TBP) (component of TFIID and TFIIIB)